MGAFKLSPETIITWLPGGRSDKFSDMDFAIMAMTEFQFETRDGKDYAIQNGKIVADPVTLNPIHPQKVIASFFEKRGWLTRIEGSTEGGSFTTFQKDWIEKNPRKDPNGPEFQSALADHAKGNSSFNWYE